MRRKTTVSVKPFISQGKTILPLDLFAHSILISIILVAFNLKISWCCKRCWTEPAVCMTQGKYSSQHISPRNCASIPPLWRNSLQEEISSPGQPSSCSWPCQAGSSVVIFGTPHNWAGINPDKQQGTEQQHQQGRAGQVRNELHREPGQVWGQQDSPGSLPALAPALGTLPIPFCEVLETQAEFVVVPEELWIIGDFRQENLCNF